MQKRFSSFIAAALVCGTIIGLTPIAKAADKADPTGTWTWSTPGRGGGDPVKSTLKLKLEGEKLTGKLARPGRDGQVTETEIGDGKVKGEEVSFTVTREFNNNKIVTKYAGKLSGDTIKGEFETPGRNGGEPRKVAWEAKREKK